jgi:hypothetical protein
MEKKEEEEEKEEKSSPPPSVPLPSHTSTRLLHLHTAHLLPRERFLPLSLAYTPHEDSFISLPLQKLVEVGMRWMLSGVEGCE